MTIVKGGDNEVRNRFEAKAKFQGLSVDEALTEAMILWTLEKNAQANK